ncbi:M12 family metallopeptidase [Olivibacter sp. CPCC 100613]|uniref:M12 family metallopeptidase n=1 Tax=Olivibacter sp. CPCC 100613 TaxID=3079931 RepID=UPI002FF8CDE0
MKKIQLIILLGFFTLNFFSCKKIDQNLTENNLNLSDVEKTHSIQIDSSTVLIKEQSGKYYLAEDIILTQEQFFYLINKSREADSTRITPRSGVVSQFIKTWPGGVVPYVISSNFPDQERITQAISHYNTYTPIRLIPRTNQSDYVVFNPHPTISQSYVGRIGGGQAIDIYTGHKYGNVIHEIGHAIGLFHEHQRPDRDNYINIDYTKISGGTSNVNYQKIAINDIVNIGPFDFSSIMMYGSVIDNAGTIAMRKKDGSTWEAQRLSFSNGDVQGINYLYLPFTVYPKITNSQYEVYEEYSDGVSDNFRADQHVTVSFFEDASTSIPKPLPAYIKLRFRIAVSRYGSGPQNLTTQIVNRDIIVSVNATSYTITLPYTSYNYLGYYQPGTHFETIQSVERIQ